MPRWRRVKDCSVSKQFAHFWRGSAQSRCRRIPPSGGSRCDKDRQFAIAGPKARRRGAPTRPSRSDRAQCRHASRGLFHPGTLLGDNLAREIGAGSCPRKFSGNLAGASCRALPRLVMSIPSDRSARLFVSGDNHSGRGSAFRECADGTRPHQFVWQASMMRTVVLR